jgi:hypothetical protein
MEMSWQCLVKPVSANVNIVLVNVVLCSRQRCFYYLDLCQDVIASAVTGMKHYNLQFLQATA